jgi:hypothetical protein
MNDLWVFHDYASSTKSPALAFHEKSGVMGAIPPLSQLR